MPNMATFRPQLQFSTHKNQHPIYLTSTSPVTISDRS